MPSWGAISEVTNGLSANIESVRKVANYTAKQVSELEKTVAAFLDSQAALIEKVAEMQRQQQKVVEHNNAEMQKTARSQNNDLKSLEEVAKRLGTAIVGVMQHQREMAEYIASIGRLAAPALGIDPELTQPPANLISQPKQLLMDRIQAICAAIANNSNGSAVVELCERALRIMVGDPTAEGVYNIDFSQLIGSEEVGTGVGQMLKAIVVCADALNAAGPTVLEETIEKVLKVIPPPTHDKNLVQRHIFAVVALLLLGTETHETTSSIESIKTTVIFLLPWRLYRIKSCPKFTVRQNGLDRFWAKFLEAIRFARSPIIRTFDSLALQAP